MKGLLLDTNVISELRKPNCDERVKAWADSQPPTSLYLSRVTIAEIRYGIERLPTSDRSRRRLEGWLTNELRPWFSDRLLDLDEDVSSSGVASWKRARPCAILSLSPICSSQQPRSCTTCAS